MPSRILKKFRQRAGSDPSQAASWNRQQAIEVWWQDEARVGQKNKITRRWARRGTRPSAPHDQRTQSAYIFGAICPERGVGAALVLPRCDSGTFFQHRTYAVTPSGRFLAGPISRS